MSKNNSKGKCEGDLCMLQAVLNFDLEGLMSKLTDPGQHHNYEWIRMRIGRMWAGWISMAKKLSAEQSLAGHSRKRVGLNTFS